MIKIMQMGMVNNPVLMHLGTALVMIVVRLLCMGHVRHTVAALNIEPWCNIHCLFSLSLRFWRVLYMVGMNKKRPTAVIGTLNHAKISFSTEIFAASIFWRRYGML
jgi:hypothetical protein